MKIKLLLIFLIAFLIRLIAFNQSLWLDEATTARVVQQYNYFEIITKFSPTDFHPPLYYLLMKSWTNVFRYSEAALRFPSVIFSLLAGYFVYRIAKLLNGQIAELWATAFFLFNPLIIYYSQEARMYMMVTMFLTMALYYFLRISKLKSQNSNLSLKSQILFNLFVLLSLLTFYGSIFLVITFLIYFLYKKQYRNLFICLFVVFGYFAIMFPLLYQQLMHAKVSMANVANWTNVLGKANFKNLLLIPVKFSIGRIDFYPKWLYYGIAGGWVSYVLWVLFGKIKSKAFFVYLLIFPLFLGFVASFITPLLQYFRFLYLVPIMAILLSFSLLSGHKLHLRGVIAAGGFLIFSLVYLLLPQFHREDWKSLVKSLPKDRPVYMITSSSDPVKYYDNKIKIYDLRIKNYELKHKNIIVIPYTADIHGVDYQKILQEKKYEFSNKKIFRSLELEYWTNPNLTESVK